MAKIDMKPPTKTPARRSKLGEDVLNSRSDILSASITPVRDEENSSKTSGKVKDLNFKVSPEFHKQFKMFAFQNEITMADLLSEIFLYYQNPNDPILSDLAKKRNSHIKK